MKNELVAKQIQNYLNERFIPHKKSISNSGTVYIRFLSRYMRERVIRISDHPMKADHELYKHGVECFNVGTYKHAKGIRKCLLWVDQVINRRG